MNNTSVKNFFSLEEFPYADVFEGCEHVWEVLEKIPSYLKSRPLGKIEVPIPAGVNLDNPSLISIGKGTILEPGAYIKGPCIIGENCEIRHGAYLRGNVIVGNRCVIGQATEVKNSILLSEAKAPHYNYVGDSVLGCRTNLGAGVVCANLRFDQQPIFVMIEGVKYPTGLKKFGVILGDDAQVGCNSVINPGSLIGKGAICSPCLNFGGWIPENVKVRNEQNFIVEGR